MNRSKPHSTKPLLLPSSFLLTAPSKRLAAGIDGRTYRTLGNLCVGAMTRANHRRPATIEPRPYTQRELMLKAEALQRYAAAAAHRAKWLEMHGPYVYKPAPLQDVTVHPVSAARARELLEISLRRAQDG